jgi:hypothetical protein
MKKSVLKFMFVASIIAAPFVSQSQINTKGSIIIDPYYGFPNFGKAFLNSIESGNSSINTTAIGPCGIRAEYMLADKFGMGLDFIYNSMSATYQVDSLNIDNSIYKSYDAKLAMQRYRLQLRMNYHFVSEDKLDAYVGFGAGTNIRKYVYKNDMPNADTFTESGTLLPFSMRIALGMRYYFTNNIGFNAELGLGGPLVSLGLSVRF